MTLNVSLSKEMQSYSLLGKKLMLLLHTSSLNTTQRKQAKMAYMNFSFLCTYHKTWSELKIFIIVKRTHNKKVHGPTLSANMP